MLLLPNNLKCVADFADKKESGARWAVTGVQVEDHGDGKYTAAATDTKALIVVEGKVEGKIDDYPQHGALVGAPNGAVKGLIPANVWKETFDKAAKKVKTKYKPILSNVALQMSDDQAVLGWTNLEQSETPVTKLCEGRFPPYRDVLPKRKPLVKLALDPQFVIRMAKSMEMIKGLEAKEDKRIELSFWGDEKPMLWEYQTPEQKTTVLIMPLVSGFDRDDSVAMEAVVLAKEIAAETSKALQEENIELRSSNLDLKLDLSRATSERDIMERERDELKDQLEGQIGRITELKQQHDQDTEMICQLEDALLQVRRELSAALDDKEMYRQRAEAVAAG